MPLSGTGGLTECLEEPQHVGVSTVVKWQLLFQDQETGAIYCVVCSKAAVFIDPLGIRYS